MSGPDVNPYRKRLYDFPGRLYPFVDLAKERAQLVSRLAGFPRATLEVGSGSGAHLIEQAVRDRECFFVGFEQRFKRAVRTVEKADKLGLVNVSVVRTQAQNAVKLFDPNSFDQLFVNFPDPWEKASQRKKRFLAESFLDYCDDVLKTNKASVDIKTDCRDYFEEFLMLLVRDKRWKPKLISTDFYTEVLSDPSELSLNVQSEFERLFVAQGLPVYALRFNRSASP